MDFHSVPWLQSSPYACTHARTHIIYTTYVCTLYNVHTVCSFIYYLCLCCLPDSLLSFFMFLCAYTYYMHWFSFRGCYTHTVHEIILDALMKTSKYSLNKYKFWCVFFSEFRWKTIRNRILTAGKNWKKAEK